MRIYLACTVRGSRDALVVSRRIRDRLESLGHEILTGHLLADDVERQEGKLTEGEVFARDLQWLHACDALVAEASGSSFGVGFEVGYVLARAEATGQRVFLLYDAARRGQLSRLISGAAHPSCTTLAYRDADEVDRFLARHFVCSPPARRD